jgi:hypothetical protein
MSRFQGEVLILSSPFRAIKSVRNPQEIPKQLYALHVVSGFCIVQPRPKNQLGMDLPCGLFLANGILLSK